MVSGLSVALSFVGLYYFSLRGINVCNMSIDSHLITKSSDTNLREIEKNKPFLENWEFKKGIFHFYFSNFDISLGIYGTLHNFRTYRKHYDLVNCVSDCLNMA